MINEITTDSDIESILQCFRENDLVNLSIGDGNYIYLAGGILSKLVNHKQYIAIDGEWMAV